MVYCLLQIFRNIQLYNYLTQIPILPCQVSSVGGRNEISAIKLWQDGYPFADKRPSTSLSVLSAKSLVELHQSIREKHILERGGGLTPPPRIISVHDGHGHKVVTELVDPGAVMSAEQMHAAVSANMIPSKYKPLQPIQTKKQKSGVKEPLS